MRKAHIFGSFDSSHSDKLSYIKKEKEQKLIVQRDGNRAGNDVESGLLRCVLMFNDASSLMLNYIN